MRCSTAAGKLVQSELHSVVRITGLDIASIPIVYQISPKTAVLASNDGPGTWQCKPLVVLGLSSNRFTHADGN